jgi:hypothetical protein
MIGPKVDVLTQASSKNSVAFSSKPKRTLNAFRGDDAEIMGIL